MTTVRRSFGVDWVRRGRPSPECVSTSADRVRRSINCDSIFAALPSLSLLLLLPITHLPLRNPPLESSPLHPIRMFSPPATPPNSPSASCACRMPDPEPTHRPNLARRRSSLTKFPLAFLQFLTKPFPCHPECEEVYFDKPVSRRGVSSFMSSVFAIS